MTRNQKSKQRNRQRREVHALLALHRWNTCCRDHLTEWSCYCFNGCPCCGVSKACGKCGTLYRDSEIERLTKQTHENKS